MEMWQKKISNGNLSSWTSVATSGEEPDDPGDLLQAIVPPIIAFYDSPGFMATPKTPELQGPKDVKTDRLALVVFLRQNFTAWIDGRRSFGKPWERVSDEVKWHSNQSLNRFPYLNRGEWQTAPGTEVALGHTQGRPG